MNWNDKVVLITGGTGSFGKLLSDGFRYASNNNSEWLSIDQIREMIRPIEEARQKGKLE